MGMPTNWAAIGPQRLTSDCKFTSVRPTVHRVHAYDVSLFHTTEGGDGKGIVKDVAAWHGWASNHGSPAKK
jgi:hypothetical protein